MRSFSDTVVFLSENVIKNIYLIWEMIQKTLDITLHLSQLTHPEITSVSLIVQVEVLVWSFV